MFFDGGNRRYIFITGPTSLQKELGTNSTKGFSLKHYRRNIKRQGQKVV